MTDFGRTEAGLDRGLLVARHEPAPLPAVTDRDRLIARLLLTGVTVGGAWLALRVPAVRRLAWRGARAALLGWLPSLLAGGVREAWRASAAAPDGPGRDAGTPVPGAGQATDR